MCLLCTLTVKKVKKAKNIEPTTKLMIEFSTRKMDMDQRLPGTVCGNSSTQFPRGPYSFGKSPVETIQTNFLPNTNS